MGNRSGGDRGGWRRQALPGIAVAAAVVVSGRLARTRYRELPRVTPRSRPGGRAPVVDVIVLTGPRFTDIAGCVASLWTAGANRVVVVADPSSHPAAARAADFGAEVVTVGVAPPGWLDAPYARWSGAARMTAGWLAWVTAEVRLVPGALDALAELCDRQGLDGISPLLPSRGDSGSARLCAPIAEWASLLGSANPGTSVLDSGCLLVRHAAYERIGGHADPDIRRSGLEGRALARRLGPSRTSLLDGDGLGAVYGGGVATLAADPTRAMAPFLSGARFLSRPAVVAAAALVGVPVVLAQTLWRATPGRLLGSATAYAAGVVAMGPAFRRAGDGRLVLLHPAASLLLLSAAPLALVRRLLALQPALQRQSRPATGDLSEVEPLPGVALGDGDDRIPAGGGVVSLTGRRRWAGREISARPREGAG